MRQAKVEEVVDNREESDNETVAPSQSSETPPSYNKGDDIAAAIRSMTADKRESLLELLAEEGF